jgi:tetratricopeptide (TPR) repeat protein
MADDPTVATVTDPMAATVAGIASVRTTRMTSRAEPDDVDGLVAVPPSHYREADEIARGGMGRICVARDRRLARWVAVKDILVSDADVARRFEREIRITARLQHPSIVSVYEAGLSSTGRPFYAMPLVKGRSLDDVIRSCGSLADRLALIPNLLAVADAMAYAHGEGIIHRDLKPHNVLVGGFGETVVIDWGIAKSLDDPADRASGRFGLAGGVQTVDGAVIGTPAYMSPEQAGGSAVDERSDVYALGAMLVHVLTGKPPYAGGSTAEVLAQVLSGPPADTRVVVPDAPAELHAIVARAMAREPADRYASARGFAEDLRRFQTGQLVGAHRYSVGQLLRRWARRHRGVLAVTAAGVVAVATLAAVTTRRIVDERERAEVNRTEADDLAEFMLTEMHDKLKPLGHLELLDAVARKAAAHYGSLAFGASDEATARRAVALANIGDVLAARGDLAGANAQITAALAVELRLAFQHPDDPALERALVERYLQLGKCALQQHALPVMAQAADAGGRLAQQLLARQPDDSDARLLRAELLELAATADEASGKLAAAKAKLLQALDFEAAVGSGADESRRLQDAADTDQQLGRTLHGQGDVAAAIVHMRSALATAEVLEDRSHGDPAVQHALAQAHGKLGDEEQFASDEPAALAEFRASLAIYDRLSALDPTNAVWRTGLASSHRAVGTALGELGDVDAALPELRAAVTILEALAAKDRTNLNALNGAFGARRTIGKLLSDAHRPQQAIDELHAALALADQVIALTPNDHRAQRNVVLAHGALGAALTAGGDAATGLDEQRASLHGAEKLAAADPTDATARDDVARAHRGVGDALHALARDDEAIAEARMAVALDTERRAKDPGNSEVVKRLALAHELVGDALVGKDAAGAIAEYTAALELVHQLDHDTAARSAEQADTLATKIAAARRRR